MLKVIEGNVEQNWKTPYDVAKDVGLAIVEAYKALGAIHKQSPWLDNEFDKPGLERNTLAAMFAAVIAELQSSFRMGAWGDFGDAFRMAFEMLDDGTARSSYDKNEYEERLYYLFATNHEKVNDGETK